jgi:hypothetical protein
MYPLCSGYLQWSADREDAIPRPEWHDTVGHSVVVCLRLALASRPFKRAHDRFGLHRVRNQQDVERAEARTGAPVLAVGEASIAGQGQGVAKLFPHTASPILQVLDSNPTR